MWLLVINCLVCVLYGIFSGHYRLRFLPLAPRAVAQDLRNVKANTRKRETVMHEKMSKGK